MNINNKDNQLMISKQMYLAVLENEIRILFEHYYNIHAEGTGHYNTAVHVLHERMAEIALENKYNVY